MTQTPTEPAAPAPVQNKPAGMAIASMVLGIVAVALFCIWYISIPCAIVGLILGLIAGGKVKSGEGGGAGFAKTGVILSIVALGLVVLLFILALVGISIISSEATREGGFFDQFNKEMQKEMDRQRELQEQQRNSSGAMLPSIRDQIEVCWVYARCYLG